MKLVFATHNRNKLVEIQQMINSHIELVGLTEINHADEIEETGSTLSENALIKARAIYNLYNFNTFADDTGLEIDALNGAPGVYSARFAGKENNAHNNMKKVLNLMEGCTERKARFKTVIALIINGNEYLFEGAVVGEIIEQPIGEGGFGYDPIFKPDGYNQTFAQMDPEIKNKISHRGMAFVKLVNFINLNSD